MIEEPIKKRRNIYPKDFTPSQRVLNTQVKQSEKKQFSFSGRRESTHNINRSTQLHDDSKSQLSDHKIMLTINPEQASKIFPHEPQRQVPLIYHQNHKRPYLNPEILRRPRMQQKIHQQIPEASDPEGQSLTPGSIKRNSAMQVQLPLDIENPVEPYQLPRFNPNKKMNNTHQSFKELLKNNQINIYQSNMQKKNIFLPRGNLSEQKTNFKLSKKLSSPLAQPQKQSSLLFRNRSGIETPEKNNILNYGYLLEENKVSKLKEHINQFVSERSKNKLSSTNLRVKSNYMEKQQLSFKSPRVSSRVARAKKILSSSKFYPELGITEFQKFQDCNDQYNENQTNGFNPSVMPSTHNKINRIIPITYKTSMNSIKQLYHTIQHAFKSHKKMQIQIKVPQILMGLQISSSLDRESLYATSFQLFQDLQIPPTNLNIKRYSNCVIMVAKTISIIYHYSGKIYLGGWQTMYLDQGVRHGLGLEWTPNKYAYYGEYVNNKRQGLGVYKDLTNTFIGEFRHSRKTSGFILNNFGEIFSQGQNSQAISSNQWQSSAHDYNESDTEAY